MQVSNADRGHQVFGGRHEHCLALNLSDLKLKKHQIIDLFFDFGADRRDKALFRALIGQRGQLDFHFWRVLIEELRLELFLNRLAWAGLEKVFFAIDSHGNQIVHDALLMLVPLLVAIVIASLLFLIIIDL